ncbi:MAG: flagellar basal body P-ring protein FlgI, partial [Phycisphaerales bacterium]|nr:flagellar basal body P-ring protein FlgI [Phycisphaerales bacterium]
MRTNPMIGARRLGVAMSGLILCLLAIGLVTPGCNSGSREKPRTIRAPIKPRDVPAALRGIIASQATIMGLEPTRISGLGFVVGLNNTGGGTLNDRVMFHMEREMGLLGVGQGAFDGTPFEGMSPRRILQNKSGAVVVAQALIPPGAPEGARYDVFVTALNATSLEGGRLYTTALRLGPAMAFGGPQTTKIGEAHGNIFINPFAEPGEIDSVVTRTAGRILNGGVVTESRKIRILLDNPSHSRSRQIVSAINSRFPERPGDAGQIARGRDDRTIEVDVPTAYRDRSGEFAQILAHIQIDQSMPHVYARRYVDALRSEPYLADDLSWALHALGEPALPFMRGLYDDPEMIPRLAALRTGARLGDPRVAAHLIELTQTGSENVRADAVELLG